MDGLLSIGVPLVVGRAIEEFAPSLDVTMPMGIAGQPMSTVVTAGLGLVATGYAVNEMLVKKRAMTPTVLTAALLGGTLLSGRVVDMFTGMMPTPAAARVVVRPTRAAAGVRRPVSALKLY